MKRRPNAKVSSFQKRVFAVVKNIPCGTVLTYQQVAKKIGSPHGARAVGNALKTNYNPAIPCHRVIRSDGALGGYNRGKRNKRLLLKKEGFMGFIRRLRTSY